jgi:hypothetical protein
MAEPGRDRVARGRRRRRFERRRPAGWWQASDGRWYPPALARHPAAQSDPAAARWRDEGSPPVEPTAPGPPTGRWSLVTAWIVLLLPLVMTLAGIVGVLGTGVIRPAGTVVTGSPPKPASTVHSVHTATTGLADPATTAVVPLMPATRDDCEDGGWADLVDDQGRPFRNQGDCISFLAGP